MNDSPLPDIELPKFKDAEDFLEKLIVYSKTDEGKEEFECCGNLIAFMKTFSFHPIWDELEKRGLDHDDYYDWFEDQKDRIKESLPKIRGFNVPKNYRI